MVEDEAVILVCRGPQTAADDLHEQHFRFGRASEDDAPDVPVHAHGEHADIADHGILAAGEFLPHLDAL